MDWLMIFMIVATVVEAVVLVVMVLAVFSFPWR